MLTRLDAAGQAITCRSNNVQEFAAKVIKHGTAVAKLDADGPSYCLQV